MKTQIAIPHTINHPIVSVIDVMMNENILKIIFIILIPINNPTIKRIAANIKSIMLIQIYFLNTT